MSMGLDIRQEENYLHVQVTGIATLAESNAAAERMFSTVTDRNARRILVDCRELKNTPLPTMEVFQHAEFLADEFQKYARRGLLGNARFAYVFADQLAENELNRFGETVALNRGANIRVFNKLEAALRFLDTGAFDCAPDVDGLTPNGHLNTTSEYKP